jgi:hypothetical protein
MAQAIEMRVVSCGAKSRDDNTQEQCGQELEAHFGVSDSGDGENCHRELVNQKDTMKRSPADTTPLTTFTRHRKCTTRCESEGLQASCSRSMSFIDKSGDGKLVAVA